MSSWSRPPPPHLSSGQYHADPEVNKPVRASGSHERASDRGLGNGSETHTGSKTSMGRIAAPIHGLPARPDRYPPRIPSSPPRTSSSRRYLPAGSLDPRESTHISLPINRSSERYRDGSRTNGHASYHDRRESLPSLVDDREDSYRPPPPRPRSPPGTEPTPTLERKRNRKQSQYVPSFIPSLDDGEPGQLPVPVASSSSARTAGALVTELAEIDLARSARSREHHAHALSSSHLEQHQHGGQNGSISHDRYATNNSHASTPWPVAEGSSPLYRSTGMPRKPEVGSSRRGRSPSADFRATRDHWSPPRSPPRRRDDRLKDHDGGREYHHTRRSSPARHERSPSREYRRRDSPSPSYRRRYRDDSVESRDRSHRPRSVSRSRSRNRMPRDDKTYELDRRTTSEVIPTRKGSTIDRYKPVRRYSTESDEWSDRDDRRGRHARERERDRDRDRDRPISRSRDRHHEARGFPRAEEERKAKLEDARPLQLEGARESVKIPFQSKETASFRETKSFAEHPHRIPGGRTSANRRSLSSSPPPPPPPEIRAPVPPPDSPLPPVQYVPPPPPASTCPKVGRGDFLVLYDPQTSKTRKAKEQIIRYDGEVAEGKDEIVASDARLTISKEKRLMGFGPRKNRSDGLVETPTYSWNAYSSGSPPANAICISELSHLTTPSDVTQKIKELKSNFSYSDGRVKATVDIASIDLKLDKKGAYMGLCRVEFKGRYPLSSASGEAGGSSRHRQREADIKAGEIIAANRFAQHVVRALHNTRIGLAYKVQNEKVRVVLDRTGAKLAKLEKEILAKRDSKGPVAPLKPATPAYPATSMAPSVPTPNQSLAPLATPQSLAANDPAMQVPVSTGAANGTGVSGLNHNNTGAFRTQPVPLPSNPVRNWHPMPMQSTAQPFHPLNLQHRFPAARPLPSNLPFQPQYQSRLVPPRMPHYAKYDRYGPFHPQNPHHTSNRTLLEHYQAQMRSYEDAVKREERMNASRATAGDDFIDAPFKPQHDREGLRGSARAGQLRETETGRAEALSETSSDTEEDSDNADDLVIDPKTRLERHKGRGKTTTTPVKSGSAAMPTRTPIAPGEDVVAEELRKNGYPYIFVPKVTDIEAKDPEKSFKHHFKGCHDVLHDQLGWYMLFTKEHGASVCLKIAKMRSFPLGKIEPEVRGGYRQPPAANKDDLAISEHDARTDKRKISSSVGKDIATTRLEKTIDRRTPKQRKATSRRVHSESPMSDIETKAVSRPIERSLSPILAGNKLDAAPGLVPLAEKLDPVVVPDNADAVVPFKLTKDVVDPAKQPEKTETDLVATLSNDKDTLVVARLDEKPPPDTETVLPAVDVSIDPIPAKKGKRKPAGKEDKRQPPKKRAKKNQPVKALEPVDIMDIDLEPMEIDQKPVVVARPPNIDPLASGLAQDEEDLYLLRLVVEFRAKGEYPILPEEATRIQEEAALAGESEPDPGEEEEEGGYIHPSGCARAHGYYKVEEVAKSQYLPQRNRAIVEVDQPAGNTGTNASSTNNNNAVASSRSARVATRRFVQGIEQSKKAADADSDVFAFNQLRTRKKQLKFQRSPIHDWGLYAVESITAGEMVIEYVGEVIRAQVADIREKWYEKIGIGSSYLFRVDDDAVVDATKKGSMARLINHCCTPNCTAKIITINGEKKIVIYAKTNILPGDEITYDYHFPIESPENKVICLCGSPRCRGFLN